MAFVLEDVITLELLNDPKFVKWFTIQYIGKENKNTKKAIQMHTCTEKDFAKFYQPSNIFAERFEKLRKSNGMQCIDWEQDDIQIFGSEASGNFGALDIVAVPCHMGMDLEE